MSNSTTKTPKRSRQSKGKDRRTKTPPAAGRAEVQKIPEVESDFVQDLREGWIEELSRYAPDLSTDNLYALRNLAELVCCAEHHGGRASRGLSRLGQALNQCAHSKGPFANIELLDRAAEDAAKRLEVLPNTRRIVEHGLTAREAILEDVISHLHSLPTKLVEKIGLVIVALNLTYKLEPVRMNPEGVEWPLDELRDLKRPAEGVRRG